MAAWAGGGWRRARGRGGAYELVLIDVPIGDFGTIRKTPVTASIVDRQASLYGHGCRKPGNTKITFGTGALVLTITSDKPIHDNRSGLLPG